jgi:Endonuclease-reverse transcriptase
VFQTSTSNMMDSHIIQWNCRDLLVTSHKIQPSCCVFKKLNIPSSYSITLRSYSLDQSSQIRTDGHPCGGVALLIGYNIPHTALTITSPLQVAAVSITSFRPITVCCIYLPAHSNWNDADLRSIIQQLSLLFLGDLNAHNMWGCTNTDVKGKYVENFLMENNFYLLNNN